VIFGETWLASLPGGVGSLFVSCVVLRWLVVSGCRLLFGSSSGLFFTSGQFFLCHVDPGFEVLCAFLD
jgi:hypothetical protein